MKHFESMIHVTNSTFMNDVDMAYDNLRAYYQGAALRYVNHAVEERNRKEKTKEKFFGWIGYKAKTFTVEDIVQEWDADHADCFHPWYDYADFLSSGCGNRWVSAARDVRDSAHDQMRNQGSLDLHIASDVYNYIIRNASN